MNTNSNHRTVSIAIALTGVASIVTLIGSAGAANASVASEPRGGRIAAASTATHGSYGEPLAALGGQSLAEYVDDHYARLIVANL